MSSNILIKVLRGFINNNLTDEEDIDEESNDDTDEEDIDEESNDDTDEEDIDEEYWEELYNLIRDDLQVQAYDSRNIDKKSIKLSRFLVLGASLVLGLIGYAYTSSELQSPSIILNTYVVTGLSIMLVSLFYSLSAYIGTDIKQFPDISGGGYTYEDIEKNKNLQKVYSDLFDNAQKWIADNDKSLERDATLFFNAQAYLLASMFMLIMGIILSIHLTSSGDDVAQQTFYSTISIVNIDYNIVEYIFEPIESGSWVNLIVNIVLVLISPTTFILASYPFGIEIFSSYVFKSVYQDYVYDESTEKPKQIRVLELLKSLIKNVLFLILITIFGLYYVYKNYVSNS